MYKKRDAKEQQQNMKKAYELQQQGWKLDAIASYLGYRSRGAIHKLINDYLVILKKNA